MSGEFVVTIPSEVIDVAADGHTHCISVRWNRDGEIRFYVDGEAVEV